MSRALLFAGQGAQKVGMGRSLSENSAAARALYDEAHRVLGWKPTVAFDQLVEAMVRADVDRFSRRGEA